MVAAIDAVTTTAAQPWYADAVAYRKLPRKFTHVRDYADHFMTQYQRRFMGRQFTIRNMQIGTAYAACRDADQYFKIGWKGNRYPCQA